MFKLMLVPLIFTVAAVGQNTVATPPYNGQHYPKLIQAELPLYPDIAWAAHMTGAVEIEARIEKGLVVSALIKSQTNPYLANPSVANLKSWRFQPGEPTTFTVTYTYNIEGAETDLPENPKIEMDLPMRVNLTARPFRPSCSDCPTK
jgi:hypothetical protein